MCCFVRIDAAYVRFFVCSCAQRPRIFCVRFLRIAFCCRWREKTQKETTVHNAVPNSILSFVMNHSDAGKSWSISQWPAQWRLWMCQHTIEERIKRTIGALPLRSFPTKIDGKFTYSIVIDAFNKLFVCFLHRSSSVSSTLHSRFCDNKSYKIDKNSLQRKIDEKATERHECALTKDRIEWVLCVHIAHSRAFFVMLFNW